MTKTMHALSKIFEFGLGGKASFLIRLLPHWWTKTFVYISYLAQKSLFCYFNLWGVIKNEQSL